MAKSETDLRDIIKERCEKEGRAAVALALDVKPAYISMILSKTNPRPISEDIAKALGYRRETAVQKIFLEL